MSLDVARQVLRTEAEAIRDLEAKLDDRFLRALDALEHCQGRIVTTGMGKSGIIARKIAATFASTGSPPCSSTPPRPSTATWGCSPRATWSWPCRTPARPRKSSASSSTSSGWRCRWWC